MINKRWLVIALSFLLILLVMITAAFSPPFQSFTPIRNLRVFNETQLLGPLAVSGAATFADTVGFSGAIDLDGQKLDLDADADTSMTADTDDQIDFEIGGGDVVVFKEFGAATIETTTTTRLLEILDTTPVMSDNTNSMIGLNVDLGIGNSTGGTNSVYGILVDGITADAQNTETAIGLGSGWDQGIDAGTNTIVNIGNAGTDFDGNGGLTTASTITVTTGGLDVAGASDIDDSLTVLTFTVTYGGADIQGGSITLANDETINNDTDGLIGFGGGLDLNNAAQTVITDGDTITPLLYSGYVLTSTYNATLTLAACSTDFQPLFLYNEAETTIVIADSNIRTSDGNQVDFNQYDILEWMCVNEEWGLVKESNNQ